MKLKLILLMFAQALALVCARAQSVQPLDAKIAAIINRPEYRHALFGIEIYSLTDDKVLYALNADKLFVPGSVTKVVTEGTALQLLGADYRFHTRIYRTGPLAAGVVNGDLVLVASGDPNLSNRVRPDDTLAFENEDHAYGQILKAKLVAGDPLQVIRDLAKQVATKGIKRITGRVLIDVSLFPEGPREGGSGVVISPVSVNDNVIDVIIKPGQSAGSPTSLQSSPATKYATFQNEVTTAAKDSAADIEFVSTTNPDGTLIVKVRGTIAAGDPRPFPFVVPQPSRFAQVVLTEALQQAGVEIGPAPSSQTPDWKALAALYTTENQVAEHTSPPIKEDVKVTLKVSQNLHAAMKPYLFGALLSKEHVDALQAGFKQERAFLQRMNLNPSAAAQSDGAGGNSRFTPDFIVKFLAFMTKQKEFRSFYEALPILGKDGSLADTLRNSPAAGKVRAKTGTHVGGDLLNEQIVVNGKGLAGYLETKNGKQIIFAIFANNVPVGPDLKAVFKLGDALGEIAATAYDD
ncbi:MAG TPA: D-alanyl-D-alanine carboxypeptidase/D-alanyl-D-alanine-endopeptidase [Pyrinomonadaceae bacterium]|jgi:D-alanyl-D-alanine carboxypeptidase/D-alanyl-D-alanine-endopeptidase (penicillin-binding protein 4)|nr:D-alanyl-D-alanine carboxypeptidase/D-alanyl-D-alanine-endopeptidase [Pyrinomonadaceae bacterium]